jgi:TP901 family phage tail tape measure protein
MADIDLNIGGNTRSLEKEIRKTVNKNYTINLKTTGDQPLGRITGKVSEFNKSLEASNARVIAFGASAGLIFALESAFKSLAQSVVDVEKALQDINVILNVSSAELQKFGDSLFDIAKNTGQSFLTVSQAATEFSRQGLSVEETLKRTSQALILSRLSGLDAAKSVEALTAAVNSYASQAVTASEVVNKFANVDAAFAVSSADLAEALARVGSSAAQSGVSLNELIAIVTSAQQTTARGGAVIGNSFKTIFTRLQRSKIVNLLESLGLDTKNSSGELKSTIQLLAELGQVYDTLGSQQQASVAEAVGGVFQINILKAALADLGKEYSIYSRAVDVAASSTDEAIQRNEELNKTYAAQLNALRENAAQFAANAGGRLLGPSFDRVIGGANAILGGINESDGKGVGATLAKGILDGLGQVLAGPGLALIGGVLIKLFKDFSVYASGSVKELLGLNTASKQQADIQKSINNILSENPSLLKLMTEGTAGLNKVSEQLLINLRQQTIELQKQEAATKKIASQLYGSGVRVVGGVPTVKDVKTKAEGYIPAVNRESRDIKRGVGGARPGDKPLGPLMINGAPTIVNSGEKLIPNFGGSGETAVLTREMQKAMSASNGFLPNFAELKTGKQKKIIDAGKKYGYLVPAISESGSRYSGGQLPGLETPDIKILPSNALPPIPSKIQSVSDPLENQVKDSVIGAAAQYTSQLQPLGRSVSKEEIEKGFGRTAGAKGALQGAIGAAFEIGIATALDYRAAQRKEGGDFDVRGGANLARVQELFGTNVGIADFKVGVSKDTVENFYGKILKENRAGALSPAEKNKNALRQAELEAAQKHPSWFTNKGVLKTQDVDPATVKKRQTVVDRLRSKLLKTRYSNFSKGYIPNFAARRVGYLDGDVLDDPRYKSTVEAEIKRLGIKGGVPEYHKYLGDLVKKARKSGNIKKFTGIFGVPGAGKSTMMLGGRSASRADNAKARQTTRIPILTPADISKVDEVIDTRASLTGTSRALQGGYWSDLDRLMVLSSSTKEEQNEIKRRRNLRDAQITAGTSQTAFGRTAGTSQGANLDSGYIEAMALAILGPNKTRVMGINANFGLTRKKGGSLPLVEKRKIGLAYGAFSPTTKGHLEMMKMAEKQGIPPEDFIVAISREGGKIDPKDSHSFRTAIFDQKTRKFLARKTFQGANVVGADPNLFGGSVPSMLEVDPIGGRRRFLSAKKGSKAFVGSDKTEKDLLKYTQAGYEVEMGQRTEGISGTDARAAILAADSKLISKIFADHVISTVQSISPAIRNRAEILPEVLKRVNAKIDKDLVPIQSQLAQLPARITKNTPPEVAEKIYALREQRGKYTKLKQSWPPKILRRLGGIFPKKYGIPNASQGFIPNFADGFVPNFLPPQVGRAGKAVGAGLLKLAADAAFDGIITGEEIALLAKNMAVYGGAALQEARKKVQDIFNKKGVTYAEDINAQDLQKVLGRKVPDIFIPGNKNFSGKQKNTKNLSSGFLPGFADISKVMALESAMSGEKATFHTKPFPHVRNKSQPTFASAMSDHGGLGKALRDSASSQKSAGIISSASKGRIPNFAVDTLLGSDFNSSDQDLESATASFSDSISAVGLQLSSLAGILLLNKNSYSQSLKDLTRANIEKAKKDLKAARASGVASPDTRRALAQNVITARQGTVGQKLGAVGKAAGGGFALTTLAPIIAETVANAIPQQTKGGRVAAAAASGLGQVGSFAGIGATIGGPLGAGIGAAAGALLSLPNIIGQLSTNLPELAAAAKKATQELTKNQNQAQALLQAYQQYTDSFQTGDQDLIAKAQAQLQIALNSATEEQRAAIESSLSLSEAEAKLAAIIEQKAKETKNAKIAEELADVKISNIKVTQTGPGLGPGAFESSVVGNQEGQKKVAETLQREIAASGALAGKTGEDILGKKINTEGRQPEEIKEDINSLFKDLKVPQPIIDIVNATQDSGVAASFLNSVLDDLAENANTSSAAINAVSNNIKDFAPLMDNIKKAFDALSLALERNINFAQTAINAQNQQVAAQKNFQIGQNISENATFSKDVLSAITGQTSKVTQDAALLEGLAQIQQTKRSGVEEVNTQTSASVINSVFGTLIKNLESGGPLSTSQLSDIQDPKALVKRGDELAAQLGGIDVAKIGESLNNIISQRETGTYISEDVVAQEVKNLLTQAKVGDEAITSTTTEVLNAIQQSNIELKNVSQAAKNAEQQLITQTSQQNTLIKINQALAAFGGINEYINPPEIENPFLGTKEGISAQNATKIKPVTDAAQAVAATEKSLPFRYNNRESIAARQKEIPGLGSDYLKLITNLRERTGGLYTPQAGSQAIQYAEQGRTASITEELKAMVKLLRSPEVKGTGAAKEIEAAIRAVQGFGIENVAKVQVAQATGTALPEDLIGIAKDLKSTTQKGLIETVQGTDLQGALAGLLETGEPQVDALNSLNQIQANSYNALVSIQEAITTLAANLVRPEEKPQAFSGPSLTSSVEGKTPPKVDVNTSLNLGGINISVENTGEIDAQLTAELDSVKDQLKTLMSAQGIKFAPTNLPATQ